MLSQNSEEVGGVAMQESGLGRGSSRHRQRCDQQCVGGSVKRKASAGLEDATAAETASALRSLASKRFTPWSFYKEYTPFYCPQ